MSVADAKGRRFDGITGLAFAVLALVSFLLPGPPPKADESAERVVTYFTQHRSDILAGDFLLMISSLLFLWFLGALRSYLRAAEGGEGRLSAAAFGGGVVGIGLLVGGVGVLNGIAFKVAQAGDQLLVRGLYDVSNGVLTGAGFGFAVLLAAASCSAARSGAFAPWVYWSGSVIAVLQVIGGIALFAKSGFFAVGGAFSFIAPLTALVWVAAVSVVLFQRVGLPPTPRAQP